MHIHPQHGRSADTRELRWRGGRWLRGLREAAGLSQLDLARLTAVEYYTFISQIESGRGRIPPERYEAWAKALGLPTREFVIDLLHFYDPVTWGVLFDDRPAPDARGVPPPARRRRAATLQVVDSP